jgi:hypothetical protein
MRSIAVLASRLCEYMIYAAATVALRPVVCDSQRNMGAYYMCRPTRPGLTMNKNRPVLVELGLYKGDRRDEVLEHISFFHVIQGNLMSNESLPSIAL